MKSIIISAILLGAVLFGGALYTEKLTEVSVELVRINEEVQKELEAENYDAVTNKIGEMSQYLGEHEATLAAMGNHEEIDKIRMNLAELYRYSNDKMRTEALSKSEVLEFLYIHLPKNYKLRIENVF